MADAVLVRLRLDEHSLLFEILQELLAAFVTVQPRIRTGFRQHDAVFSDDLDHGQPVPAPEFEVVEIMSGSDLQRARSEFLFDVRVRNHRDESSQNGQNDVFTDETGVPSILGMDRHCGISEHGFGPRRGDHQRSGAVFQRIAEQIEPAVQFLSFHLDVG